MNSELVTSDSSNYTDELETPELLEAQNTETKLLLPQASSTTSSTDKMHEIGEQISIFLQDLPTYVSRFFRENQGPLRTVALVVGALIAGKLTLALLDAMDDIPLVAPILELIGLGYTGWFVYRYLLRASNRQELYGEFNKLKNQVLGSGS